MFTLQDLASMVDGEVVGDPQLPINGVSEIQNGIPGTITFLANPRYKRYLDGSKASAIIVNDKTLLKGRNGILVPDPQLAVAMVLSQFSPLLKVEEGIHPMAVIDPSVHLEDDVTVGAHTVIEGDVTIGAGTRVGASVFIGQKTQIGRKTVLNPHCTVYHHCQVGDRVLIHSGSVIGCDGFGFVTDEDRHHKIPQNGRVVIGNDVEIGANCALDRGTIGDTVLEDGTKLDNLVHIAHNVHVGRGCLIASSVIIAGSVEIGDLCIFAGQAGVAPHIKIGERAVFAARSGITKSLPGGKVYAGFPAREIREQNRRDAIVEEVKLLRKRMDRLEQQDSIVQNH